MRNQFNNFYLKIILIFFTLFVLVFIVFYDKNDLFKLPFDSRVWGTASDWVIIFVTIATAYWLIRTFKEQKRANDIALNKDRREILPQFSVVDPGYSTYSNGNREISTEFVLQNNPAHSVIFMLSGNNRSYNELQPNSKHPMTFVLDNFDFHFHGGEYQLGEISFKDIDGRKYIQNVLLDRNKITISYPRQIFIP